MLSSFISILITSISQLLSLIGLIIGVGFLLGFLERQSVRYFYRSFGKRGYMFTSYIGTPIHELGHVLMCVIFRHRIGRVQWFPMASDEKVLGYVEHSYARNSTYQKVGNFFVGTGPIVSGILSLIVLMYFLLPDSYQVFINYIENHVKPSEISVDFVTNVFFGSAVLLKSVLTIDHFINPFFWLFIFLAMSISTHIALSKPDINGAISGIFSILGVLIVINIMAELLNIDSNKYIAFIASYNAYVLAFSSLAILFSILTLVICYSLYLVRKKVRLPEWDSSSAGFRKVFNKLKGSVGYFQVASTNAFYKEMSEDELHQFVLQLVKSLKNRELQVNLICVKQNGSYDTRFNELTRRYLQYVDLKGIPVLQFVGPNPILFTDAGTYIIEDRYHFTYIPWEEVDYVYAGQDSILMSKAKVPTALAEQIGTEEFASMLNYLRQRLR